MKCQKFLKLILQQNGNLIKVSYPKECDTGSLHTLAWIAEDYAKHHKHHMNQIISESFDVIYE